MQATAGLEVAYGGIKNATPVRDHRQAVGNQYVIERPDAEQEIRVEAGSIAVRDADSICEAAP